MSSKMSDALSAGDVIAYHSTEFSANYSASYYSENGKATGLWFGKQCDALGLTVGGTVDIEHFSRLANGQTPLTGEQLIAWKRPGQAEPRWLRGDEAWKNRVEALVGDSVEQIYGIWGGTVESHAEASSSSRGAKVEPVATVHSARESALLEMHEIARQMFIDNLQAETGAGARDYLARRGIRPETTPEFGVGLADASGQQLVERLRHYGPDLMRASGLFVERQDGTLHDRFRDRLMFPIENERGETIAFGGRRAPTDTYGAKYINSPAMELYQKSETLYNLHRASDGMQKTNQAVLVEGYLDVIAAHQAGQPNVVAPCGTSFTEEHARTVRCRVGTVVVNFDEDDAGKLATERAVKTGMGAGLEPRVVSLDQDPAAWLQEHGAREYKAEIRKAAPFVEYLVDRASEKFDVNGTTGRLEERLDALHWIADSLVAVPPERRAEVSASLERHLGLEPAPKEEKPAMEHRAGWDLTFSAPKSYSVTALVGGDYRLVDAHDEAVREALAYGERAIQVKMGGLNAPENTGKLVAALFRHDTSRPVDGYAAPQLHTHCVIFNMSQDGLGQFRALNPTELYHLQSAMDAVYQARLAYRAKEYGYQTEHGANHSYEIKGYTKEYLAAESERTAEIEAEKERRGQHGPRANTIVALKTRAAKSTQTPEEITASHREHAEEHGNQPEQVITAAQEREARTMTPEERGIAADRAVDYARLRLSERTSVMEWYEVDRDALRLSRANFTLEDVEVAFDRAENRGDFQETHHWRDHAPEARYTTPELEGKERRILHWMVEGKGKCEPIAGEITRDEFREQFRAHLNDGQKHLVWNLIHSHDRMVGVQGWAGTGKTTALGVLKTFAEEHGFEVHGVAATGGASNELNRAGVRADTLAGFMEAEDKDTRKPRLYLLDEASLADVHQMSDFLERMRPTDRVVVIGDVKQHGSVGAGAVFKQLQDAGMETFRLRTIVRQQTEEYREVVRQFSRGEIKEALQSLDDRARIHELTNEDLRHKGIAVYCAQDPAHTLVVAPDNRARVAITEKIREELKGRGDLGQTTFKVRILEQRSEMQKTDLWHAINYNPGDVLVYAKQNEIGMRGGDRAIVMGIDIDHNMLTVMRECDGKTFAYNPFHAGTSIGVYESTYREFAEGDRVQFTRNMPMKIVTNRQLGTIVDLRPDGYAKIELDGALDRKGNPKTWSGNLNDWPFLDHGYCMTSYSAQGASVNKVLIHLDTDAPHTSRMLTQQLIYVAASRGKQDIHVFTNNLEELKEVLYRLEQSPTALAPAQTERYTDAVEAVKEALQQAKQEQQGMAIGR